MTKKSYFLLRPSVALAKEGSRFFIPISYLIFLISYFLFLPSPTFASGIRITPAFQDINTDTTSQAVVNFSNQTQSAANFSFSLVSIQATDLLGRLQFNAPLPQTIKNVDEKSYVLTPQNIILEPNQSATVSAQFVTDKLNPGTSAFLLMAKIDPLNAAESAPQSQTALEQYVAASILVTSTGGATLELELTDVEWSWFPIRFNHPDFVTLTLKNTGNTRVIPSGVLQVKDMFGREVMRGALNKSSVTVLPGSQRLVYGHLQPSRKNWPLTLATLTLSGSDESRTTSYSFSRSFLYLHPITLAVLLLIPLGIYIKRSRRHNP
jgi:hypothetical protein